MTLTVNGESRAVAEGTTLTTLLEAEVSTTRGVAAAVDGEVVPRSRWDRFLLADGQAVELITAVQGG